MSDLDYTHGDRPYQKYTRTKSGMTLVERMSDEEIRIAKIEEAVNEYREILAEAIEEWLNGLEEAVKIGRSIPCGSDGRRGLNRDIR